MVCPADFSVTCNCVWKHYGELSVSDHTDWMWLLWGMTSLLYAVIDQLSSLEWVCVRVRVWGVRARARAYVFYNYDRLTDEGNGCVWNTFFMRTKKKLGLRDKALGIWQQYSNRSSSDALIVSINLIFFFLHMVSVLCSWEWASKSYKLTWYYILVGLCSNVGEGLCVCFKHQGLILIKHQLGRKRRIRVFVC